MRKKIVINLGDSQPLDCSVCKSKHGYQVTDNVRCNYTIFFDQNGDNEGGSFGDSHTTTRKGTVPFCANCGNKLDFKVTRLIQDFNE